MCIQNGIVENITQWTDFQQSEASSGQMPEGNTTLYNIGLTVNHRL